VTVLQIGVPVTRSSAMSRPSSVAMNSLSSYSAGPREFTSQQAFAPAAPGTFGS
jgi:hypothetical protein